MAAVSGLSAVDKDDKIFVPPMEPIGARFTAAVFRSLGYRSEVLEESPGSLEEGIKYTSGGECLPCPSTMGAMINRGKKKGFDPGKAVFFMPSTCGPCRFGQYATLAKLAFKRRGWEQLKVLSLNSDNSYGGIGGRGRKLLWHSIVTADLIKKVILRLRPYEKRKGEINRIGERWVPRFVKEIEKKSPDLQTLLRGFVREMKQVPVVEAKRPKVAVVGEIYVRSDPFINNNLIDTVERLGGEVLMSTLGEWIIYCAVVESRGARSNNGYRRSRWRVLLEKKWLASVERKYAKIVEELIPDRKEPKVEDAVAAGERYVPKEFTSEAILTVGRALLFIEQDKVDAVVNASPVFCMPGTISASIFSRVEREYNVPVISNFYDGYGDPNKSLAPYMHYLRERKQKEYT